LAAVSSNRRARLGGVLAWTFLLATLSRFPWQAEYPNLREARAADFQVSALLSDLPARGALFTYHFETGFMVAYQRLVEGTRPDVDWAHLAFAGNAAYVRRVAQAEPDLRGVLGAGGDNAALVAQLERLHPERPVRIEPNLALGQERRQQLGPAGELWSTATGASLAPVAPMQAWQFAEAAHNRQTRGYLAWRSFVDAQWSCDLGLVERARQRFAELARLVPEDKRFRRLQATCQ
jgi:hypothetical protein